MITEVHAVEEDWDRFEAEITATDAEAGDDPVVLYMREIGRVDLLTAAEERDLAAEIELANHLVELQRELALGLGNGDGADDASADGCAMGERHGRRPCCCWPVSPAPDRLLGPWPTTWSWTRHRRWKTCARTRDSEPPSTV